jgi:predicted lipase
MRQTLETLTASYPTASILLTGHSLGAALASFLALETAENYPHLTSLYTFGGPRIGNGLFADQIEQAYGDRVYRVTHGHDFVTQLPSPKSMKNSWIHYAGEYNVAPNGEIRK